ncbi:MAG: tRNA preQ1(34) S-adenosylmethionine ribosyltransferase-isomerase QueA [candidate division Zixibacteria bacterium]|nr:tRNA preQ1(34) S-adenosylmethionine ribosyltransferase-isomerase QueA [candidate division Zixibacteria bacterium]
MRLSDYDYKLPKEYIAQYPCEKRDHSRLLVLHRKTGEIEHRYFYDIGDYLNFGDCLVINDSKVFAARLFGKKKPTGGKVEVFLLRQIEEFVWEALVNPGRKLPPGTEVQFEEGFGCEIGNRTDVGGRIIRFTPVENLSDLIDKYGRIPLPPYVSRDDEAVDRDRYQTVYASVKGAVAAPTAGFHFTPLLLDEIQEQGIKIARITLHPSLGTFRPVTVQDPRDHKMHSEYFSLSPVAADVINATINKGGRIIAVGTTSVRTLEKVAIRDNETERYKAKPMSGSTDLYIYPPYDYKLVDALITNFHLPKSTLLFLVSALAGREKILNAYEEAKRLKYRFFSYGDAMLII